MPTTKSTKFVRIHLPPQQKQYKVLSEMVELVQIFDGI